MTNETSHNRYNHSAPYVNNYLGGIKGKLGKLEAILMHIHKIMLKREEFSYLCLSWLTGKETPNEGTLEHYSTYHWCTLYSTILPLIKSDSYNALKLVCN